MTGVSPSLLKIAKVVPVFKNVFIATIVQSRYYQILKKYLKNLYLRDCIPSFITKIVYMIYSLDSDSNILHLMP